MAKGKKNSVLSLEEKLEYAFVSADEQPYAVPENWCWVKVGSVCVFENGYAFKADKFSEEGTIPVIRISNIKQNEVDIDSCVYTTETNVDSKFFAKYGDLLIAMSGATTGKNGVFLSDVPAYVNQRVGNIKVKNEKTLLPKYRNYYIMAMEEEILRGAYGGAQPNISSNKICDMNMPLPPLAEQQRIVEQIEGLFEKLDEAEEKVQQVLSKHNIFTQATLRKAFCGELTTEWRKCNNIEVDTWEEKTLASVCKSIYDGDHMPPPKAEGGINFLVISNVNKGHLSLEGTRYVPQEYYDSLTETRKPELGDVLYTLVGSYGIPVVVDTEKKFCFQRHMGLLKPDLIDTYFLWYQLQSQEFFNKATAIANGTAQLTVPIKGLRQLTVKCPSFEEQKEIVMILNNFFEKQNRVKEIAEKTLEGLTAMRKAILTKAFRGELGTNSPDEESAVELLKRILENK